MTDIGTDTYTILAQTAAEVMGVPLDRVAVMLGDRNFPVTAAIANAIYNATGYASAIIRSRSTSI